MPCLVDDCPYPVKARGYCMKHYGRLNRGRPVIRETTPASTYFWRQVEKTDECWLWLGKAITPNGYGRFSFRGGPYDQRRIMAHRWAYTEAYGPIPDGLEIDHLCRNRLCVRPDHLEAVTHRENTRRSGNPTALNAAKTHCLKGHPFDKTNTYLNPSGERICRACSREKAAAAYRAKRIAAGFSIKPPSKDRTHCPQGHEYTTENTSLSDGRRHCKQCLRDRSRAYYLSHKS